MSLHAPVGVVAEISAGGRRVFRLAESIGQDGLRLHLAAPFEPGRPVDVTFTLPDDPPPPLVLRARIDVLDEDDAGEAAAGGRLLTFVDPPAEARTRLAAYLTARLGLPG